MSASDLLSRLSKVRRTGPGQWLACCPAHNDRKPSLAIRECEDGRVLAHCFSHQCPVEDIVAAVGLELDTLFPPKEALGEEHSKPRLRRPFNPMDALRVCRRDLTIGFLVLKKILDGQPMHDRDRKMLLHATANLSGAINALGDE